MAHSNVGEACLLDHIRGTAGVNHGAGYPVCFWRVERRVDSVHRDGVATLGLGRPRSHLGVPALEVTYELFDVLAPASHLLRLFTPFR